MSRRISRRTFLTGLGVGTGVVVAGAYGVVTWRNQDGSSISTTRPSGGERATPQPGDLGDGAAGRTLVLLEFAGGNDGLNTVVPYAAPEYARLRPTLGVTEPLDLDGEIGLHPKLGKLAERFRAGHVAIVEGIGYPEPDLSHFESMQQWWTALDPTGPGWLGRYLDGTVGADHPTAGIAVGGGPSPVLRGERSYSVSITDATGLQPKLPGGATDDVDALFEAWQRVVPADTGDGTLAAVYRAIEVTVAARGELADMLVGASSTTTTNAGAKGRRGGGSGSTQEALALAAQLVLADDPPRVIHVRADGDFDTHQGQAERQPTLMEQLDAAIEAFWAALEAGSGADGVVLMTTSEFGRRPAENGTGTDHGTANAHFVMGPSVRGGRYGEPPSLTGLDDRGNLVMTTDLRAYYATALDGWLGVDPEPIVGKGFEPLEVFA